MGEKKEFQNFEQYVRKMAFHLSKQTNKLEITQKSWYVVHEYFISVCCANAVCLESRCALRHKQICRKCLRIKLNRLEPV